MPTHLLSCTLFCPTYSYGHLARCKLHASFKARTGPVGDRCSKTHRSRGARIAGAGNLPSLHWHDVREAAVASPSRRVFSGQGSQLVAPDSSWTKSPSTLPALSRTVQTDCAYRPHGSKSRGGRNLQFTHSLFPSSARKVPARMCRALVEV